MKTIFLLRENGVARGAYIARELGVSKPTVSVSLKEMEDDGYLKILDDHTIILTESGEQIAKNVVERNKIIFDLLVGLGVDKTTALSDACRIEHSISDESIKALVQLTKYMSLVKKIPFEAD